MSDVQSLHVPHQYRMLTVRGIYFRLDLALLAVLIAAGVRSGSMVVVIALSAIGGGILAELAAGMINDLSMRRSGIGNGRAVYYGLLVTALAPVGISPALAAAATALAVLVGLWLPGGPGAYWLHPVLVGIALLPGIGLTAVGDALGGGPAALITAIESSGAYRFLENRLFAPFGVSVSAGAVAALTGIGGVPPATLTAGLVLPLLVSAMIVFGEDIVPAALPVVYFIAFAVAVDLLGGEPLTALVTGNVPVVGLIVLADPGVRPVRTRGMVLFGALAGILTAVVTVFHGAAMPAVTGLLLAGSVLPLIDLWTVRRTRG
jgi:Na+-translocating ferredoxin:NAD+ oxidoreductase RnfD subunit